MNLAELRKRKAEILAIAARNGISDIRVFGSVARGDTTPESDVDLLVKVLPGTGIRFFGFGLEIEEALGCKVDVVSEKGVNVFMKERIFSEAVPL